MPECPCFPALDYYDQAQALIEQAADTIGYCDNDPGLLDEIRAFGPRIAAAKAEAEADQLIYYRLIAD